MKIVFATGNKDKLREINEISQGSGIEFILPEAGFNPVEDGLTFEENSYKKAKEAVRVSHKMSLADDSGLCVDALNGAPGLYSARYAGTQQEKINKILKELEGASDRSAKFVCVMTLLDENGEILHVSKGECKGEIAEHQSGVNGFGYDPVFVVENYGKTMAEMSEDEKNQISHRGRALTDMLNFIRTLH